MEIAEKIFNSNVDEKMYPGINNIAALLDENDEKQDYWLTYELGGISLTKTLFDVKGQFHKGERIYNVNH